MTVCSSGGSIHRSSASATAVSPCARSVFAIARALKPVAASLRASWMAAAPERPAIEPRSGPCDKLA
eukprot:5254595-Prymnesium_polylepis.2